jgi:hypothetical protein
MRVNIELEKAQEFSLIELVDRNWPETLFAILVPTQ